MVVCLIALPVLGILSVFSVKLSGSECENLNENLIIEGFASYSYEPAFVNVKTGERFKKENLTRLELKN